MFFNYPLVQVRPRMASCAPLALRRRDTWDALFAQQQAMMDRFFDESTGELLHSPAYRIKDDDKHFQVSLDVPGMTTKDIEVEVNDDDVLTMKGSRNTDHSSYNFRQSFSLGATVVADQVTASLKDGVLTITAPKDPSKVKASVKKIPISEAPTLPASAETVEVKQSAIPDSADADTAKVQNK